ncbi:MAG: hypothetical protein ACYDCQ_15155 [Dehalococcoidia bacterium]
MTFGRPRLYLDEDSLGPRREFAARGYAVFDVKVEGLLSQPDEEQLVRASMLDAILITGNRYDFEILMGGWRALRVDNPGIVAFQGSARWTSLAVQAELIDRRIREVGPLALRNTMQIWEVAHQRWRVQDGRQKVPRRR